MSSPRPVYSWGPKKKEEWGSVLAYNSAFEHECTMWEAEQAYQARKDYEAEILLKVNGSMPSKLTFSSDSTTFKLSGPSPSKLNPSVPTFKPRSPDSNSSTSSTLCPPLSKLAELVRDSEYDSKVGVHNKYLRPIGSAGVKKG